MALRTSMYVRVELTKVLVRYKMSQALPPTGPTPYSELSPLRQVSSRRLTWGTFIKAPRFRMECWGTDEHSRQWGSGHSRCDQIARAVSVPMRILPRAITAGAPAGISLPLPLHHCVDPIPFQISSFTRHTKEALIHCTKITL